MASRRAKKRALTVASMTLPRTPDSDGAAADAAAGGALDGGVGVGVVVGRRRRRRRRLGIDGHRGSPGRRLLARLPQPASRRPGRMFSGVVRNRKPCRPSTALSRSRPLRTFASIRSPAARSAQDARTRRPHKRPADAWRSVDEMTSLPTSTSSAAHRRPRQKPRTMPLVMSLKLTVPSTKHRAGTRARGVQRQHPQRRRLRSR